MNNIDIANGIIFKKMELSKDSFDARIICQKKIYLLQSLGTDLGYSYNWYVRGPYSPLLANYLYTNIELLSNTNFDSYRISEKVEENISRVNSLQKQKPNDVSLASWYELLASLLYIDNNRISWKIENDKESLFKTLIQYKPKYNQGQCTHAFDVLENEGFICVEA